MLQNYKQVSLDELKLIAKEMKTYAHEHPFDSNTIQDFAGTDDVQVENKSNGLIRLSSTKKEIDLCIPYTKYILFEDQPIQLSYYEMKLEQNVAQLVIVNNLKMVIKPAVKNKLIQVFLEERDYFFYKTPAHVAVVVQEIIPQTSLFANSLQKLFDESQVFTRKEWSEFLSCKETDIENWITDKDIPPPMKLNMLYTCLVNSDNVPDELILQFKEVAAKSARDVSPFGKRMLPTVWQYMKRLISSDEASALTKMSPTEQEKYLDEKYPQEKTS